MSRLIDADALSAKMYHEAFETDSDMQKWDSGCWIRYKMFENAIESAPTIEPKMCEDAVSRQVAIDTLIKWMRPICINNTGEVVESDVMVAVRNILKTVPSVQPERPKGKWIWELDEGDPSRSMMLVCSICGSRRNEVGTYNFCNICGAKMINPRGEQDE